MNPFSERDRVTVRALLVGEGLDLRALENTETLANAPLMITAGDRGAAALFRYGAVVLFDVSPVEEMSFLAHLRPLIKRPVAEPESEVAEIRVDPAAAERATAGVIGLRAPEIERLQVVADVLARSVALARHEATIAEVFDRIEPLAEDLQRKGAGGRESKELLRHIGETLRIQHRMVGRVEVEEKPDLVWEHPDLERLFLRMAEEYELRERHRALERKLLVISRTAETLLGLVQNSLSLRVEWYIVILIVAEILIMIVELVVLR